MNLEQFKNEALNQGSVSKYTTSGNSWKDGGYLGQCVSLINQYCYRVINVPAGAWGDAKDWPSNPNVQQYFDSVSSPQPGDVGVMGSNYGGGYGHIFIYLNSSTILEQNGSVTLRVTTRSPYPNPISILRRKGGDMPLTEDQIKYLYRSGLGREAQTSDIQGNVGKDPGTLIDAIRGSKERGDYQDFETTATYQGTLQRKPEVEALTTARTEARTKFVSDVQGSTEAKEVTAYYEKGKDGGVVPMPLEPGIYKVN